MTRRRPRVPVGGVAVVLLVLSSVAAAKVECKAAMAQIENLGVALDTFRDDVGRYPTDVEGLRALAERPETAVGWDGPYLKKRWVPSDPWDQPFVYHSPARFGSGAYDLYSTGRNAQDERGRGDDITSWSGVPCGYARPLGPLTARARAGAAVMIALCVGLFVGWRRSERPGSRRVAAGAGALPVVLAALFASYFPPFLALAGAALAGALMLLAAASMWPAMLERTPLRWIATTVVGTSAASLLGFWAWDAWLRC